MHANTTIVQPSESAAPPALRLVAASCQYPAGLLDATPSSTALNLQSPPLSHLGPADRSAELMRQTLQNLHPDQDATPTWTVLMGDQVYVDETAGVFDPAVLGNINSDGVWQPTYRRWRQNRVWRRLRSSMDGRCFALPDDHEFVDNWASPLPGDDSAWARTTHDQQTRGLAAYWDEQRSLWPHPYNQAPIRAAGSQGQPASDGHAPLWVDLGLSSLQLPLFLADTRTERPARTLGSLPHDHIMSATQRQAIEQWLARGQGQGAVRFLISASAVLPRPVSVVREPATALHHDNWCGYPASQAWLLEQIYEHCADNLVLLSGDEHLSSVGTVVLHRPGGHHVRVTLVHSSALYAPYPFANAQPRDFVVPDAYTLPSGLQVSVESFQFVPGDGFAIIECPTVDAASNPGAASLLVRFVRHHSQTHEPLQIDLSLHDGVWRGGESPPHQS